MIPARTPRLAAAARTVLVLLAAYAGAAQAQPSLAQAQPSAEALAWLHKIQQATRKLPYAGTVIYQHGGHSETSRVTRYVGSSAVIEKLEVLDGEPREIVRTRDAVKCYLPGSHVVKVDRRAIERDFPALLPERLDALEANYEIRLGGRHRVSGFDCQLVILAPRDDLRYGYRLYADRRTGMLLKAATYDDKDHVVEQFTFTQLDIGHVGRDKVRAPRIGHSWRIENADAAPADLSKAGWTVEADLPGFQKVAELKRRLGDSVPVGQVVYSDGLTAVSVFIEPLQGHAHRARPGLASMGAIHIYTREVADHLVTAVGEAPAVSVQRIADGVEYRPR